MAKAATQNNLIVGLDIGTSKVVAVVGEIQPNRRIKTIGLGTHPSQGLKRGVVVDIKSTIESIQRAVEEAELTAGCQIHSCYTGISGSHIRSLNSHGIVGIRDKEVSLYDVERVIDAAKTVAIPADQKILHILPQEFIIDNQSGIKEPVGMSGVRLEAKVHMVTSSVSAAENNAKCVRNCGLNVEDIVLEQLASSLAVLNEDEKELGVCLLDMGGGTTDIAVFSHGAISFTSVIPIGGDQVTSDIAVALRTPLQSANDIKIKYGSTLKDKASAHDTLDVPTVGARSGMGHQKLSSKDLAAVIEPRYEELFFLVKNELQRNGKLDSLTAGIVLTGGASKMPGVMELASRIFQMPVRQGKPEQVEGLKHLNNDPVYSAAVGLLLRGMEFQFDGSRDAKLRSNMTGALGRMKRWFQGNF